MRCEKDDISALATKLAFYLILSIFPFFICLLELIRRMNLDNNPFFDTLEVFVPDAVLTFFSYILSDIQQTTSNGVLPIAFIFAVWSASRGVHTLAYSLNKAYKEKETRNFLILRVISFFHTGALLIILVITGALIVFGKRIYMEISRILGLPDMIVGQVDIMRYLLSITLLFIFFIIIYNLSPNKKLSIVNVLPGTLFSTLGIIGVSFLFSIYVNNSTNLSYIYGSLTSLIVLMLWLQLCSIVIILGGELNAQIWEWFKE